MRSLQAELARLEADNERLRAREAAAIGYIRDKVDQLLRVIGTLPLLPEELDDHTLISLDPIGIISDAFEQVLEHLKDTNDDRAQSRDQLQAILDSAGAAIVVLDGERRIQAYNAKGRELFFPASCEDGTDVLGRLLPEHRCCPPPLLPSNAHSTPS